MHLCRKGYDKADPEDHSTGGILVKNWKGSAEHLPVVFRCGHLRLDSPVLEEVV